jgi:hypothetical protein
MARVRANVAAVATLRAIEREDRTASASEQVVLARWSGWGAVPETFDASREDVAWARRELADLLSEEELAAAARSTLKGPLHGRRPGAGDLGRGAPFRL